MIWEAKLSSVEHKQETAVTPAGQERKLESFRSPDKSLGLNEAVFMGGMTHSRKG